MAAYVLLTSVVGKPVQKPHVLEDLGERVVGEIERTCPDVRWLASYTELGDYDYVDVFVAPAHADAVRVVRVVRSFGYPAEAMSWNDFRTQVLACRGEAHAGDRESRPPRARA